MITDYNCYTIKGKTDGFGSQYQGIMSGIAYCYVNNIKYIHTPFNKMEHNVDSKILNDFIGIPETKIEPFMIIKSQHDSSTVHGSQKPSIYYTEYVLKILRDYYYSTSKPIISNIDIAIHVRRGDVRETSKGRFTSNTEYINIINSLKKKYPNYKIVVFSEGNVNDFKEFGLEADCFKLNQDVPETFHSLVSAKILITAKSSFSYAAAILSTNIVYYMDFWHKSLDHWLSVNDLIKIDI